jgi:hypothetical protein
VGVFTYPINENTPCQNDDDDESHHDESIMMMNHDTVVDCCALYGNCTGLVRAMTERIATQLLK